MRCENPKSSYRKNVRHFFVDDIILQNILLQNMGDFGMGGGWSQGLRIRVNSLDLRSREKNIKLIPLSKQLPKLIEI